MFPGVNLLSGLLRTRQKVDYLVTESMSSNQTAYSSEHSISGQVSTVFKGHLILWYLFAPAIVITCLVYLSIVRANHDVAWLLYVTGRLLDGAQLYRDYIDPTTPFVFYFQIIPVWLARLINVPEIGMYNAFIGCLIVLSLGCCWKLINQTMGADRSILKSLVLLWLAFFFAVVPLEVFGVREHVMAVLAFPYIFLLIARANGAAVRSSFAALIGVMAGLGMSFKPFFLLLWFIGEAYIILSRQGIGWRRTENLAIGLITAIYGVLSLLVTSDYLEILPLIVDVYGPLHLSWGMMLQKLPFLVWLLTLAVIFFTKNTAAGTRSMIRILCCAGTAFFLMAFIQRKNWFYHNYPFWLLASLLFAFLLLRFISLDGEKNATKRALKFLLIFIVMSAAVWQLGIKNIIRDHNQKQFVDSKALVNVITKHAADRPIYIVTTNITLPFPTVNESGSQWRVRFHCLWPFWTKYGGRQYPGNIVSYRSPEKMGTNERFVMDSIIRDLLSQPPQLIAVDRNRQPTLRMQYFDFMGYFSQDRRFSRLMMNYEFMGAVGLYDVYLKKK